MAVTTIGQALQDARERLKPVSTSVSLDAQLLLAEVLGYNRAHIIAHPEKPLTSEQAAQYEQWISRREQGEPIAYILGRRAFYDREFIVTPDVLIPRPETEILLEMALAFVRGRTANVIGNSRPHPKSFSPGEKAVSQRAVGSGGEPQVHWGEGIKRFANSTVAAVDVGTGSGALAVTLAANAPDVTVYAVDLSEKALAVAKVNARQQQTTVHFMQGDLLQPLIDAGLHVDLVMANLPYIATEELQELEVARHEPNMALDGGADGLDLIRRLLAQVPLVLDPSPTPPHTWRPQSIGEGLSHTYPRAAENTEDEGQEDSSTASMACILLEIGADQGAAVVRLAQDMLSPAAVSLHQDLAGLDRIVQINL